MIAPELLDPSCHAVNYDSAEIMPCDHAAATAALECVDCVRPHVVIGVRTVNEKEINLVSVRGEIKGCTIPEEGSYLSFRRRVFKAIGWRVGMAPDARIIRIVGLQVRLQLPVFRQVEAEDPRLLGCLARNGKQCIRLASRSQIPSSASRACRLDTGSQCL